MLPDVGAGTPLTLMWWLAGIVLLGYTVVGGVIVIFVNRSLLKRDAADREQDSQIRDLVGAIRREELRGLERDNARQEQIHDLHVQMLECRNNQCARFVTQEIHHGDLLRLQDLLEDKHRQIIAGISELHRRIDAVLAPKELQERSR